MLLKSLKYILATIFFFLSVVLAFSDDLIVPKKNQVCSRMNWSIKHLVILLFLKKNQVIKKNIQKKRNSKKRNNKINGIIIT